MDIKLKKRLLAAIVLAKTYSCTKKADLLELEALESDLRESLKSHETDTLNKDV